MSWRFKFALGLPGAYVDHPWGETVVKVNKKIFVFLGSADIPTWPTITVKLQDSNAEASAFPVPRPPATASARAGG